MLRNAKLILGLIIVAVFLGSLSLGVFAHHLGPGQFVVVRGGQTHEIKIYNPTRVQQFVVAIAYFPNEDLDFCEGFIATPHGTEFTSTTNESGSHFEIIAAPSGQGTGTVAHNLGIMASSGKGRVGVPTDVPIFSSNNSATRECVCDRLSQFGESRHLFARFGINC